jgi:hypothetical protein
MAELPNGTTVRDWLAAIIPGALRVVSERSAPQDRIRDELVNDRLAQAGVDIDYVREAEPAIYDELQNVCRTCPYTEKCARQLLQGNWEAGLSKYCPNAGAIDEYIAGCRSVDA